MNQRLFIFISFLLFSFSGVTQPLSTAEIDSVVVAAMETFDVPGMAVAIVKDGAIYHKNTYGIRSVESHLAVNENTLFGVASNTKAFTAAALGQLVDQGKLEWDRPVADIIPEFKLYDAYVTREFTVRDLLVHRSGLGLGAGDLMVFPAQNTTTKEEMIHNLRYLKPVSSFRSKYDYDNLLYIIAGEVVARISGQDYDSYIREHFFESLHMTRSLLSIEEIQADTNRIDGHAPVEGKLEVTGYTFTQIATPAAGIYASVNDMTIWMQTLLAKGKYGNDTEDRIVSEATLDEMWTPQTLVRAGKGAYNTHFTAYGLGWFLSDVNGYLQVTHTGGLLGIVSQVTLLPELDLGIVVLTNQQSGAAFRSITDSVKDGYFGIGRQDRIMQYNTSRLRAEKREQEVLTEVGKAIRENQGADRQRTDQEDYSGRYKDLWFGSVSVDQHKDGLYFRSHKSPDLAGKMEYYKGTTFIVRWDDRTLKADAFVNFDLDTEGRARGFSMEAVSPLTDFSFNFQDLDFERVEE